MNMADVKKLCKAYDPEDKEILKYLDLKKKAIEEDKLNIKENSYIYSESNKNLYKFHLLKMLFYS